MHPSMMKPTWSLTPIWCAGMRRRREKMKEAKQHKGKWCMGTNSEGGHILINNAFKVNPVNQFSWFNTFHHSRECKSGYLTIAASVYILGTADIKTIPKLSIVLHLELLIWVQSEGVRWMEWEEGWGTVLRVASSLGFVVSVPLKREDHFQRDRFQTIPFPIGWGKGIDWLTNGDNVVHTVSDISFYCTVVIKGKTCFELLECSHFSLLDAIFVACCYC